MLKKLIEKLMQHQNLSFDEIVMGVNEILEGVAPEQVAAFLVLLHAKGETVDELMGLVEVMQSHMKVVNIDFPVLDIAGTGGDKSDSINVSTAASLLAAACGVKVIKHGNRSVSSRCGSADILEALGVPLDRTPEEIIEDVKNKGFAYCFAPNFHPSMKAVRAVRNAIGVRTSFNLLGPLTNPAHAQYLLLGVSNPNYLELYADIALRKGLKHAMVIHSCGLDELTLLGLSNIIEIVQGKKIKKTLDPKNFGFQCCELKDIQGGSVEINKALIEKALQGEPGPIADTIVLNTGVALYVADFVSTIEEGILLASRKIKTGEALKVIRRE